MRKRRDSAENVHRFLAHSVSATAKESERRRREPLSRIPQDDDVGVEIRALALQKSFILAIQRMRRFFFEKGEKFGILDPLTTGWRLKIRRSAGNNPYRQITSNVSERPKEQPGVGVLHSYSPGLESSRLSSLGSLCVCTQTTARPCHPLPAQQKSYANINNEIS